MEKYDPLMDSTKLNDSSKIESAKRFLANITWVYENVQERGTKPADGRHNRITIKRFAPGAPNSCVREVLDILTQQAPYQDPVISNTVFPGKWKPKLSWFRKDSRYETVNNKTASVTLIQELIPADEDGDTEVFTSGGNCFSETVVQYMWDMDSVEVPAELANPGERPQGVQYSVAGVNRDDDSGLFSYYITKQIAIPQKDGPYISGIQNSAVTFTTTWKNAYEIPEDLPQDGETVVDGDIRRVSRRQNDDCTWDITLEVTRTLEHDALEACKRVFTEHQHTTQVGGNKDPLPEAPPAGGGKHYEYSSKKEEDGTYTHSKTVTTEIPRENFTIERSTSLYGTRTTVVDKNLSSANTREVPEVGGSIRIERTQGGSYDVTRTSIEVTNPDLIQETKCTTIAQSVCSTTNVVDERGDETATASGGVLVAYNYNQNEYGTWNRTESITTEKQVDCCSVTTTMGIDGTTVAVTVLNAPANCTCEASKLGDSVQIEKTPGGLLNITKRSVDATTEIDRRWSDTRTMTQDQYEHAIVQACALSCAKDGTVTSAGGGVMRSASSQLTETGAYINTTTKTTFLPVTCETYVISNDFFGATTQTRHRNQSDRRVTAPVGGSVTNVMNEGGSFDVTVVEPKRTLRELRFTSEKTDFAEKVTVSTRGGTKVPTVKYGSVSAAYDEYGKINGQAEEVTPSTFANAVRNEVETFDGTTILEQTKNSKDNSTTPQYSPSMIVTKRADATGYGTWDVTTTTKTPGAPWLKVFDLPTNDGMTVYYLFGNQPEFFEPNYKGSVSSASASVSRDPEFGLWNGSYTIHFNEKDKTSYATTVGGNAGEPSKKDTTEIPPENGGSTNSASTRTLSLGSARLSTWGVTQNIKTTTYEIHSGALYKVTWSAVMRCGICVEPYHSTFNVNKILPKDSQLHLPGGPQGGIFPFASGFYFVYYTDITRKAELKKGTTDANGVVTEELVI